MYNPKPSIPSLPYILHLSMTVVGIDLFLSKMHWFFVGGGIWDDFLEFLQTNILVWLLLRFVVLVSGVGLAIPSCQKHTCWASTRVACIARVVDCCYRDMSSVCGIQLDSACWHLRVCRGMMVSNVVPYSRWSPMSWIPPNPSLIPHCLLLNTTVSPSRRFHTTQHLHALRTSCNPPSLLQTVQLPPSRIVGLALHEIIVIRLASRPNKETSRQQRRRTATDLLDRWDVFWEGGGIDKSSLIESIPHQLISLLLPNQMQLVRY